MKKMRNQRDPELHTTPRPLMHRRSLITTLSTALSLGTVQWARSETFLTPEQAATAIYPGQQLTLREITLSADQRKAIASASGMRVRSEVMKVMRTSGGDWLIFDSVIGKHEFIDIAVAITRAGSVKGVEILTYRETYGGEVRNAKWRSQFHHKTLASPVKVADDIKNISGATLSCVHVTDGVRRLLHTHAVVLKNL